MLRLLLLTFLMHTYISQHIVYFIGCNSCRIRVELHVAGPGHALSCIHLLNPCPQVIPDLVQPNLFEPMWVPVGRHCLVTGLLIFAPFSLPHIENVNGSQALHGGQFRYTCWVHQLRQVTFRARNTQWLQTCLLLYKMIPTRSTTPKLNCTSSSMIH